jgi:hypothetical protein
VEEEDVRQRKEWEEVWVKWSCTVDINDCFKSNLKYFSVGNNVSQGQLKRNEVGQEKWRNIFSFHGKWIKKRPKVTLISLRTQVDVENELKKRPKWLWVKQT